MILRDAAAADLEPMVALLGCLFAQEEEFEPRPEAQRRGLAQVLEAGDRARLLLAERDAEVVAMVTLLYHPSTALGTRVALLEDLVVHPRHRGRGIGAALLDFAVRRARADGCTRITLLTDAANHAAHRLYEGAGFRRSSMVPYRR